MERQAEALLKAWLSAGARVARPRGRSDEGAELLIREGRHTLVVEVKRLADPGRLRAAVDQVRAAATKIGRSAVPVLAVPFMGPTGRRLCEELKVSWFDLSGNADIAAPGLRIL